MEPEPNPRNLSEEMKAALAMARRTLENARRDGIGGEAIRQLAEAVRRFEPLESENIDVKKH